MRHIAHPAIRNRGTLGGSIALADPAAEYPACLGALDATIVLQSKAGERMVRAEEFFKGLFEVDLRAGELVAAVEIPALLKDERWVFLELARRHGDYAIVGLAAVTKAQGAGLPFRACEQTCSSQAEVARGGEGSLPTPAADLYLSFDQAAPREGPPRARMEQALTITMT